MKIRPRDRRRLPAVLEKSGAAALLMLVCAGVAWASCGGTEVLVSSAAGELASTIAAQIGNAGAQIISNDQYQTNRLVSALKVVTAQVSTSAQQHDSTVLQAEQAGAAVAIDIANKGMIDRTIEQYTSQGYDPCGQLTATKAMAAAEATAGASVPGRIASEVQAGGGKYADPLATLLQRAQLHHSLFCTQSDVDAGICSSVGAIPGGDSNASLIFSTDTTANAVSAKNAVINNIIGVPDAPLPAKMGATPAGAAYVMAKKERDSFLAFPIYSLKSIQADAENFDAFMTERVGQYFGTAAATSWAQDQASESERGVVVDLVKIAGLNLKLDERTLQQSLRREANEATELALENEQINGTKARAAAQRAMDTEMEMKVAP
jgi:hypothetical protein